VEEAALEAKQAALEEEQCKKREEELLHHEAVCKAKRKRNIVRKSFANALPMIGTQS
jgi:hypothetical protein